MADNERPRAAYSDPFERDTRRTPREERDRGGTPTERRGNRSRSPQERGSRRDARYRSRSPFRKDERDGSDRGGRGRGRGHDRGRGRDDSRRAGGRDDSERPSHRDNRDRSPPKGPRNPGKPPRHGSNANHPPPGPRSSAPNVIKSEEHEEDDQKPDVEMADSREKPDDIGDDEWEMVKVMGFGGFKSTKNTKVPGNDKNFGVRKDKQLQARQYMNRQGGFNRPLSPGR
ncbi:hypothetical protein G6011_00037 [Alternaria panax]|uniref:U4/U6.U5 small nuclear ribonucleoprotein 27kDa protein domain-containing protein n=1 Tax=Alternaria panax TaxID=48097 RepID=A0AAD4NUC8_9PLEO|nr:hypothetical protein G6011_00037 [Alternaria panax]